MHAETDHHPTKRTLRRFVLGTTSPVENRAVVTHLLRRCSRCSQVLGKSLEESAAVLRQIESKGTTTHEKT